MDNVKLVLILNSVRIDSTVTSGTGYYQFSGLTNNTYAVIATCSKPWQGVNGTDALKVQRHFTGLELLTEPVRLTSSDVNNSGSVNGTDALKIKRRFAGMDASFDRGDWTFEKVTGGNTIIVSGANVSENFYALCTGDVNGSNAPSPTLELATITTATITNITQNSATGGGNVFSDGGSTVTARGICWSTSANPTISNSHSTDGSGTGSFESNLTGLTLNTLYYVRAYATNSIGTAYGNQVSYTTTSSVFSIGQNYGGGIIFYIDGTGLHGLISSTTDQSTGAAWGCFGTEIAGISTAIGTGQSNTTAIVNGCSEAGIAARICNDLVLNGYEDWFLPSKDELNLMYQQRTVIGNFTSGCYWSSSQYYSVWAWYQYFGLGGQDNTYKNYQYCVRAIRAF